jgi:hypothetical protein
VNLEAWIRSIMGGVNELVRSVTHCVLLSLDWGLLDFYVIHGYACRFALMRTNGQKKSLKNFVRRSLPIHSNVLVC